MVEQYGTENLKKLAAVIIELSNVADKIATDKSPVGERFKHAFALLDELMALSGLDFKTLKKEFQDLKADERAEMVTFFNNKFDIKSQRTEQAVERTLALASYFFGAYPMVKELITLVRDKDSATVPEDLKPVDPAPEVPIAPKRSKKSK